MNELEKVRAYVRGLPKGKLTEERESELKCLLAEAWDSLAGAHETSMAAYKLDRTENFMFTPPSTISFEIERHGPTALGSVSAEVQAWTIDLKNGTAECRYVSRKLVGKRDRPLKVEPIAQRIKDDIVNMNKESEYLHWISDGKVKVLIGELIPATLKQTTTGRHRRFRRRLNELLEPLGWVMTYYNIYGKE